MTKAEKLAKLSSITVCAAPTVITYDMGFEYEVLTGAGKTTGFGDMGQWPCFKFSCDSDTLAIIHRIKAGEDATDEEIWNLQITKILSMYHNPIYGSNGPLEIIDTEFVTEIRKCLTSIQLTSDLRYIYAYRDMSPDPSELTISFMEEDIENVFIECHGYSEDDYYDDMDDEEIDECFERAEEFCWGLAYNDYTSD